MAGTEDARLVLQLLSRETKAFMLTNEFKLRHLGTHELAALLELMAKNAEDRDAIVALTLEGLEAAGFRTAEIKVLHQRLLPPATQARAAAPPEQPPASAQKTRDLHSPFRMPFESGAAPPSESDRRAREAPTAAETRPHPRQPAPASAPPPPAPPPPPPPPRPATTPATGTPRATESVERTPARGTTARMTRKQFFFGDAAPGTPTEEEVAPRENPLVLIAEDDARARMVYKLKFESSGYEVAEAADGAEAWDLIQKSAHDAIVLDMKMPGLHGLEILGRMVDRGSDVPVVICTAHENMEDEFVVATYPYLRYLVKPVSPEKLVEAVENLLTRKRAAGS